MNKSLIDSVESTCHELSQTPKGSVYLKMGKELEQVRAKWEIIRSRFSKLKEQPGKKLESDFDTLHGQTLTHLDKIQRGVKKLKLESSEPRNIQSLLDKCVVCGPFEFIYERRVIMEIRGKFSLAEVIFEVHSSKMTST